MVGLKKIGYYPLRAKIEKSSSKIVLVQEGFQETTGPKDRLGGSWLSTWGRLHKKT